MFDGLKILIEKTHLFFVLIYFLNLSVEGASRVTEVLRSTQDETGQDLLFLDAFKSKLQVLTGSHVVRLDVIRKQAQHLHDVLHTHTHTTEGAFIHAQHNARAKQISPALIHSINTT